MVHGGLENTVGVPKGEEAVLSVDFKVHDFAYPVGIPRLRWFLERSQWLPPEELTAYQEKRLRLVVRQAYHNVPYYRRIFDANPFR